jgi:molecular chaperone DnaK
VGLLQEPVAAAMACTEDRASRDGLLLIYDLCGGTVDAALVRAISGNFTVEAHEGINMPGGTDFDRMIVETIVEP